MKEHFNNGKNGSPYTVTFSSWSLHIVYFHLFTIFSKNFFKISANSSVFLDENDLFNNLAANNIFLNFAKRNDDGRVTIVTDTKRNYFFL